MNECVEAVLVQIVSEEDYDGFLIVSSSEAGLDGFRGLKNGLIWAHGKRFKKS